MTNGLLSTKAFVIQFRSGTEIRNGKVEGRIEHVASGRTACFHSCEDLLNALDRLCEDDHKKSSAVPRRYETDGTA
jgi:hypothetical protein